MATTPADASIKTLVEQLSGQPTDVVEALALVYYMHAWGETSLEVIAAKIRNLRPGHDKAIADAIALYKKQARLAPN